MPEPHSSPLALARDIQLQLGGWALTPAVAKLYSQYTQLTAGRPGVNFWRPGEASERLTDAAHLIDSSFIKKDAGDSDWYIGMRRAGEILEWLSHPQLELRDVPTRLLAAAAYQLAGYPAMAASLLDRTSATSDESRLLPALLKGDFAGLLGGLTTFWQERHFQALSLANGNGDTTSELFEPELEDVLLDQIASALGALCAEARWGGEQRFGDALEQLANICDFYMYSGDTYSWLLSRLVSETAKNLGAQFIRTCLNPLLYNLAPGGQKALELYARNAYQNQRSVIWPSQSLGLSRLRTGESFALCTPTGSGKTTVAEIALLQCLFENGSVDQEDSDTAGNAPLGMYLVPSRALAAEAEAKLHSILTRVSSGDDRITVTGLYGGTDWGPTDAWLTREGKTVLICTYEKAEAILRFLGPLFLNRLRVVVIDEAHSVEFNGRDAELQNGESRPLRLEALGARLLTHISENNTKVIALSAVAGGIDDTLASWVRGSKSKADTSDYRSTRQLIGRLECLPGRRSDIRYDLLDGTRLTFREQGRDDSPYISDALPPHPPASKLENGGPEKRLRPHLFWAALNFVGSAETSGNATVLIFVPQQIGGYAEDFISLLEREWSGAVLPSFFEPPTEGDKAVLWTRCLNTCADYFTTASREYRLLEKGIVVHHGRMPRLLSRLFVEVIEQRISNIVLATSTLAEGVNLPFEVLLVPSLRRGQTDISARELKNLVGRTGRPGVATEGRTLVLLSNPATDWSSTQARNRYENIIGSLAADLNTLQNGYFGLSPLAQLLIQLRDQWEQLDRRGNISFFEWLEHTRPLDEPLHSDPAVESLDVLDSILVSTIVELEHLTEDRTAPENLEDRLRKIWQRTYARYASVREEELSSIFVRRGRAIQDNVYTEQEYRRRLYKTSMPPRSASMLIALSADVRNRLSAGEFYRAWSKIDQFNFIRSLVELVRTHPRFSIPETLGKGKNAPTWDQILRWWLDPQGCRKKPNGTQVSGWYNFVSQNFDYRFNWGLSSVLSLAIDEVTVDSSEPLSLEQWPLTGLPWISFWIKELIIWGTLDPVVAFLLSRRIVWTRREAEELAQRYYVQTLSADPNEQLDPSAIRHWTDRISATVESGKARPSPATYPVELLRDFSHSKQSQWRVIPLRASDALVWLDPAGFPLAKSPNPTEWSHEWSENYDFLLFSEQKLVRSVFYLS
jgi:hypothetical protein